MSKINTDSIKNILSVIKANILTGKRATAGLENIFIKNERLYYHNGEIFITSPVGITENFCVKASDFCDLFDKISGEADISVASGKLKINSGKLKASLTIVDSTMVEERFAKFDFNNLKECDDIFNTLSKSVLEGNANFTMDGVILAKNEKENATSVISSDRIRITKFNSNIELPKNIKLSEKTIRSFISRLTWNKYGIFENWLILGNSDDVFSGVQMISADLYPIPSVLGAYERLTGPNCAVLAEFKLPDNFGEVITRGGIFSSATTTSSSEVIKLSVNSERIEVTSVNGQAEIVDVINFPEKQNIPEEIEFWISKDFVAQAYAKCKTVRIQSVNAQHKVMVFYDDIFNELISSVVNR